MYISKDSRAQKLEMSVCVYNACQALGTSANNPLTSLTAQVKKLRSIYLYIYFISYSNHCLVVTLLPHNTAIYVCT